MKKYILAVLPLALLSSCGNTQTPVSTATWKQVIVASVKPLGDFSHELTSEKTATIQSSSNLTVSSEWAGIISSIKYKEGDYVKAWTPIVYIRDTMTNVDLMVTQAKSNLALQDAQRDTQIINLDNSIANAKIAYDKAIQASKTANWKSNLEYDNLAKKNRETLKTYNDAYQNYLTSMDALLTQYLHSGDQILGMTDVYDTANNWFESYLWARAGSSLIDAKDSWNIVYAARGEIRARIEAKKPFTEGNTEADLKILDNAYEVTRVFSDKMIYMLQNNVYWGGLSVEQSNWWLTQWNTYRNNIQTAQGNYTTWKTQVKSFLDTYKATELGTQIASDTINRALTPEELKTIQSNPDAKLAYQNADLSMTDAIKNTSISIDQAKIAYDNAIKLKEATINQLAAARKAAEVSLMQAERNASKFVVRAPINGIITKISTEVGQNVSAWMPMFEFSGKEAQILIDIDPRLALYLKLWDSVDITTADSKVLLWNITAISPVASKNMLSTVRIAIKDWQNYIGQGAKVTFKIPEISKENKSFLLPINSVSIVEEGSGTIAYMSGNVIASESVKLGSIYGKNIEVFTTLPLDAKIIMNDVSNFDATRNEITVEPFIQQEN